jgi:hypothetical protein
MAIFTEAKGIAALVILLLILGLCGYGYFEHREVKSDTAQIAQLKRDLDTAAADNKTAQDTITAQGIALTDWKTKANAALSAQAEAVATEKTHEATIAAQATQLKAMEKIDVANPKCDALLHIDIGAVCPNFAHSLRVRGAAGDFQGPHSASAGAGAHPD